MYFDQLSGACSTWKLVEILFFSRFQPFLFISKLFQWFHGWTQLHMPTAQACTTHQPARHILHACDIIINHRPLPIPYNCFLFLVSLLLLYANHIFQAMQLVFEKIQKRFLFSGIWSPWYIWKLFGHYVTSVEWINITMCLSEVCLSSQLFTSSTLYITRKLLTKPGKYISCIWYFS